MEEVEVDMDIQVMLNQVISVHMEVVEVWVKVI